MLSATPAKLDNKLDNLSAAHHLAVVAVESSINCCRRFGHFKTLSVNLMAIIVGKT
jgi:hypothetical protein